MIHNHEVPGSIPGRATKKLPTSICFSGVFLFITVQTYELGGNICVKKQIILGKRDCIRQEKTTFAAHPNLFIHETSTDGLAQETGGTGNADIPGTMALHLRHAAVFALRTLWVRRGAALLD